MNSLRAILQQILGGRMTQFATPVQIQPSQLVAGVFAEVRFPQPVDTLWMPPAFERAGALVNNPAGIVIGVRINLEGAPVLPFGLNANEVSKVRGPIDRIFVTLLSGTAAAVTLMGAQGVDVLYNGYVVGAGTPDNTTTGGGGAP